MAQKRPSPTHKDSLIVRQRDLARESVVKDSFTTAVRWQALDLEQTIAGRLPLPMREDRGEGVQRVAEILEA